MSEELLLSELSSDELQSVSETAELTVREVIFSKVSRKLVDDLAVVVDIDVHNHASIDIEVELRLSPLLHETDVDALIDEAISLGFRSAEKKAKEILACRSEE
jgi:hypothetical protein